MGDPPLEFRGPLGGRYTIEREVHP